MIQIIQLPTAKNPTLAFTWIQFAHMEWGFDYRKHETLAHAQGYLHGSKHYVLGSNIEHFRAFCEVNVFPPGNRLQIVEEAVKVLHEHTVEFFENKERWVQCLERTIEKATFMRILIQNAPKDEKPFLIIMAGMIIDFCKRELDECKKDQDQGKADSGD